MCVRHWAECWGTKKWSSQGPPRAFWMYTGSRALSVAAGCAQPALGLSSFTDWHLEQPTVFSQLPPGLPRQHRKFQARSCFLLTLCGQDITEIKDGWPVLALVCPFCPWSQSRRWPRRSACEGPPESIYGFTLNESGFEWLCLMPPPLAFIFLLIWGQIRFLDPVTT